MLASKFRVLISILLFLQVSVGGLIYTVKWFMINGMSLSEGKTGISLLSVSLIVLLIAISLTLLLLSKSAFNVSNSAKNSSVKHRRSNLSDDEDDLDDDDIISSHGDIIQEDETGALAHSYNKVLEAMQKIHEMEKRHSIELAEANQQLQREVIERERAEGEIRYLSRKLISSNEDARRELARDLHDEFGQMLAALHLNAESLLNSIPPELTEQKETTNGLIELIEQLGDKIRNISSELRPDLLDDLGLVPTLEWYINEFVRQRRDIEIEFQAIGFKKRLSSDIELVLYRIFQECMNNIVKHAKAKTVHALLTYSHPKVMLTIRDDGVGFDPSKRASGIGLLGMKERVVAIKGQIEIRSAIGKGTTIRVELPVPETKHSESEHPDANGDSDEIEPINIF